jgi:lisH domain-containing protein FOPNL
MVVHQLAERKEMSPKVNRLLFLWCAPDVFSRPSVLKIPRKNVSYYAACILPSFYFFFRTIRVRWEAYPFINWRKMTTTLADLHDAVVGSLEKNGRYKQLQAEIRAHLFELLTNESQRPTSPSPDDFLINELIREYLDFNGYTNSLSVFVRETASPGDPMNRDFLGQALNVTPHRHIPILYSLTASSSPDAASSPVHAPVSHSDSDDGFFEIAGE